MIFSEKPLHTFPDHALSHALQILLRFGHAERSRLLEPLLGELPVAGNAAAVIVKGA
jgi:hypothetical protein